MRKLLAIASISILSVVGCNGGGSNSNPVPVKTASETATDVTDTSDCHGEAPVGATIKGTWYQVMKSPSYTFVISMTVDDSTTTLTNECHYGSAASLQTSVTVPSNVESDHLSVMGSDANQSSSSGLTCKIQATTSTLQYSLVGSCLKITNKGQTGFLVSQKPVAF